MNQQKTVIKKIIQSLFFSPLLFVLTLNAQNEVPLASKGPVKTNKMNTFNCDQVIKVDSNTIYQVVEKMPQYPGGESALMAFIGANLRYPVIAQENGIQGTVYIRFVVTKLGNVDNVEVIRSLDPACDKEAVRVIRLLPQWIPGTQQGANVSVYYTLPIKYKLMGSDKPKAPSQLIKPLFVLNDTVLPKDFNMNSINKADILRVDVLKPETEAKKLELITKYGPDAANGVVLITTKK